MRVVVFVVYVGDRVGSVGGGGTLTAMPPLGAPNGLTFGSVLPLDFVGVVAADVVVVEDVVVVAVGAADAENTPPNASETTIAIAITPALASRRDVLNIVGTPSLGLRETASTTPALAPMSYSGRPSKGRVSSSPQLLDERETTRPAAMNRDYRFACCFQPA